MAHDLRRFFTVGNCKAKSNTRITDDQKRKNFFNGLGKIGDIEVLNRFGGSKITAGLRDLAKISNSIRTGDTNSAIIPNSRGYVFDAVDINQNAAQQAGQFNPGVLNRATSQADSILESVKGGTFTLSDIPNVATDLQNLSSLIGGIFTENADKSIAESVERCGAKPYAIDLVRYAPKYKFLFVVQVTLKSNYQPALDEPARSLAFVVKTSTRPNVNIEHEEINMYNFWTRVPKRTVYEPITMRFYDDNKGLAHLFYTSYLQSISPISKQGGFNNGHMSVEWLEANSMNPNSAAEGSDPSTASFGALEGDNTSIIDEIKLYHIYDYGKNMTVYHFHHPKLLTMNLDELDMAESGTGNELEFQFAYDAMHITSAYDMQEHKKDVKSLTSRGDGAALYAIEPTFAPDHKKETPEGLDAEGNPILPTAENVFTSITGAVSGAIGSATGLVSSAFDSVTDFGGSLFS